MYHVRYVNRLTGRFHEMTVSAEDVRFIGGRRTTQILSIEQVKEEAK